MVMFNIIIMLPVYLCEGCASCHLREHYRNYNRPKNNHRDELGRWRPKNEINT
jgi:hypothetical protein